MAPALARELPLLASQLPLLSICLRVSSLQPVTARGVLSR